MSHPKTDLTPNDKKICEIKQADLPLHCPQPGTSLWNSHPRVFLPINETKNGRIRCPYCGTEYVLTDHASQAA
jgi:uncharacterized Zn-finger protein